MNIGDRIKHRRKELALSAEQVAERLGVSPATVYRYESSDILNMRIDKLEPIARVLDTTPAFLMGWDENQPTADGGSELKNSLNDLFDRLSPEEQKLVLAQIKGIIDNRK